MRRARAAAEPKRRGRELIALSIFDYGTWLPNGDPALAYDVELVAELYLVKK
jgi:hypothetical protein